VKKVYRYSSSLTLKRAKVVETITGRISIGLVGSLHAGGDHLFGHVLVIRPYFFLFFASHTYGLMIIDR
jgi:hypothetical protein